MNVNKEQTAARQDGTAPHSTEPATVNTVTVGEKHKPRKETEIEKKEKYTVSAKGKENVEEAYVPCCLGGVRIRVRFRSDYR